MAGLGRKTSHCVLKAETMETERNFQGSCSLGETQNPLFHTSKDQQNQAYPWEAKKLLKAKNLLSPWLSRN